MDISSLNDFWVVRIIVIARRDNHTIYVLLDAEIEQALSAVKVRTQATSFFARKAFFEKAKGLIEALRDGEVSGLSISP